MAIENYYCSQKFDWVEIRLYDGLVASCCQAQPDHINISDVENHPVGFFNYPKIKQDRQMMLDNQRIAGCEEGCWKVEDRGINSRRINFNSQVKKYTDLDQVPKTINLVLSNTCLQSCVYCSKTYSSSWMNDVAVNGNYDMPGYLDRYNLNTRDKILLQLGQPDLYKTKLSKLLIDQIESISDNVDKLIITGGEPLLDNQLIDIVSKLSRIKDITIFTGLGVSSSRLKRICSDLANFKNITFTISAENTGKFHEFTRYGTSYSDWTDNFNIVSSKFPINFVSVISNLTMFDFANFLTANKQHTVSFNYNNDSSFLAPNMLDPESKNKIINELNKLQHHEISNVVKYISQDCPDNSRELLNKFLSRYIAPRKLTLEIFPSSFLNWIGLA
jgi:organic radical activating enzyme